MKAYRGFIDLTFLGIAGYLLSRHLSTQLRGNGTTGRVVGHESRTDEDAVFSSPSEHGQRIDELAGASGHVGRCDHQQELPLIQSRGGLGQPIEPGTIK